eukprot:3988086-Amphidinium_carterae.1
MIRAGWRREDDEHQHRTHSEVPSSIQRHRLERVKAVCEGLCLIDNYHALICIVLVFVLITGVLVGFSLVKPQPMGPQTKPQAHVLPAHPLPGKGLLHLYHSSCDRFCERQ